MKRIAILILNYNSGKYLHACLKSVRNQLNVPRYDIYVIDNNSQVGDLDDIRTTYKDIKYILFKKNYGFTGGYNRVFEKLINEYDYFILLNPDTVVEKLWLYELVDCANKYPSVGAVVSAILGLQGKLSDGAGGYIVNILAGSTSAYNLNKTINEIPKKPYQVFYGSGCSLLVKTKVLKEIGYFDEDYFAYMEEIDLCWRMLLKGYKIYCAPKSIVKHYGSGSFNHSSFASFLIERNLICTYFKNLETKNIWMLLPIIISRLIFSLLFIRHASSKIKGVISGLSSLTAFQKKRAIIQKTRMNNDEMVFRNNPTSIFSALELFRMIKNK